MLFTAVLTWICLCEIRRALSCHVSYVPFTVLWKQDAGNRWQPQLVARSLGASLPGVCVVRNVTGSSQNFYTFYSTRSLYCYVYLLSAQVKCLWRLAEKISTTAFRYEIYTDLSISLLYYFMCAAIVNSLMIRLILQKRLNGWPHLIFLPNFKNIIKLNLLKSSVIF